MLGVLFKIPEAGKEINREVHRPGADRQLAHVGTDQRRLGYLAGQPKQGGGEIESKAPRAGGLERPRVAAGPTGHVQYPPPTLERNRPGDERHGTLRIPIIPMRIELEILFAEPFFEPFHVRWEL